MLRPILRRLDGRKIILASQSPRRKDILKNIGLPFDVVPSKFEENLDKTSFGNVWEYAIETAKGKAREIAERMKNDTEWGVIIGADTIVVKDGIIYEKPANEERARDMLNKFNNDKHTVYTGVVLIYRPNKTSTEAKEKCFYDGAEVTFGDLPQEVIESYIESREPFDKAGGYGIQALGGTLVKSINGDYFTVEGLPLHKTCTEIYNLFGGNVFLVMCQQLINHTSEMLQKHKTRTVE